jgi:phosphoglycerol transferase MdoB-like AlkP superfamily enzyme
MTPPDRTYISSPTYVRLYAIKSAPSCLFGIVQCVSTILISCMHLQNTATMHTMDVISMYTSYILLCVVIEVLCKPAHSCKPVVRIPKTELKKYITINNELSFRNFRLYVHSLFDELGFLLIFVILFTPYCLIAVLLIYINKDNALLLSLSVAFVLLTVATPLIYLLFRNLADGAPLPFELLVLLALSIALIVCSSLNATTEQKYTGYANWLPHF